MPSLRLALTLLLCFVTLSVGKRFGKIFGTRTTRSVSECKGEAQYKVIFQNLLTPAKFGSKIPDDGLVFSPLAGVSHSNRKSFLTVRGFASPTVEEIAETGSNTNFLERANAMRPRGVLSVAGGPGPVMPGESGILMLDVDCNHTFVTVLSMIAPSPDWIVQINNMNMFDEEEGGFVKLSAGNLIAYDAGTDDGGDFTPPMDTSLDLPTMPRENIAPLVEDDTDPFMGEIVGRYVLVRVM